MHIIIYFLVFIVIMIFLGVFFQAPWLPTRKKDYNRIANLARLQPKILFYDLGSGSGELLFYLSKKYNISCVGIEISPVLYLYSKIKSFFYKKVKIYYGNFFKYDISKADIIYLFLHPRFSEKIENKICNEVKEGTKIITACWPFKNNNLVQISKKEGELDYYLYIQGEAARNERP